MEKEITNKVEYFKDNLPQQQLGQNIAGMFQTVSTAPTNTPKNFFDQVQIYVNGGTLRLYWYDTVANTWHYVTATA